MRLDSVTIESIEYEVIEKIFKSKMPSLGFSIRKPQIEIAKEIIELIKKEIQCLVVEAGVGTGKSFGYLIPLLIVQKYSDMNFSIIISTGTISLQEQLIKDLNYLKEILNIQSNVVLAKGQTHFLCLDRLTNNYSQKNKSDILKNWSKYSNYGDREEMEKFIPEVREYWNEMNIQKCKFRGCAFYYECGYMKLREAMRKSNNIIVTNHDQLIANAKKIANYRKPLFSEDTEVIVVDEAHNFEEKARNSLTETWDVKKIKSILNTAHRYLKRYSDDQSTRARKSKIEKLVENTFNKFKRHCISEFESNEIHGYDTQRVSLPELEINELNGLISELESYNISLQLVDYISDTIDDLVENIEDLISFLKSLIYDDNHIFWLEATDQKYDTLTINRAPKELDEYIYSYFLGGNDKPQIIFTSATISQSGIDNYEKYGYFLSTLGIDMLKQSKLSLSEPKESPFNYKDNALLYISSTLPHPKERDNFRDESINEILRLITLTKGRAMVLFTSKSDMNFVFQKLKEAGLTWNVLLQKEGSSQQLIKQIFIEDEHSILLSTGTFWEGIDIPGTPLSNLIIYKLPFPVPDPILEYKKSVNFDGFNTVYIPEMITKLRQGLGRLIRKENDKGIASILDPRLSSSQNTSYKSKVLDSLPFKSITEDFAEVERFVNNELKLKN